MKLGIGVVVPLVTPLRADRSIEEEGLERLINHCVAAGLHGIFVLGTAGEGICLSNEQRQRVVSITKRLLEPKGLPLYVGTCYPSTYQVKEQIKLAEGYGADVVVVTPHYNIRSESEDEIVRHYEICSAHASVPVMAYNNPGIIFTNTKGHTLRRVMSIENVIGLKESVQDWKQIRMALDIKNEKSSRMLVGGSSVLGPAMLSGADGCMSAVANYAPRLMVRMYQQAVKGNISEVLRLQQKVDRLNQATHAGSFFLAGIKYACALLGLCQEHLTEPFATLNESQKQTVRTALQEEGLLDESWLDDSNTKVPR